MRTQPCASCGHGAGAFLPPRGSFTLALGRWAFIGHLTEKC